MILGLCVLCLCPGCDREPEAQKQQLLLAIADDDAAAVRRALRGRPPLDFVDMSTESRWRPGWATPLLAAVQVSDAEIVEMLIDAGADPNFPNAIGLTPLIASLVYRGDDALAELLLRAGAELVAATSAELRGSLPAGFTTLHAAALAGSVPFTEKILAAGVEVDVATEDNRTPLMYASGATRGESVRRLPNC